LTRRLRPSLLGPAATAVLTLVPTLALAHAVLVKSSPGARATLPEPPGRVELWFNERLEPAYSRASVLDAAGAQVDLRDVAVSRDDPKRLTVSLPSLGPGRYTVRFRVLSVDGHVVESSMTFTIKNRP
jgi:copper resistance protein C